MAHRVPLSCVVFALSLISFATMAKSDDCMYQIRVQTGDRYGAGTDSKISLELESFNGNSFTIDNLEDWGIMEQGHDYFERGNLDVFSGTKSCLSVCKITLTSDNSGSMPGWYVDYVEITVSGGLSKKINFPVNQWLATSEPPYQLYATVDLCHVTSELTLSSE